MNKISKGVRAFGIYFIVYSCSMFVGRVTSILYHLIQNRVISTSSQSKYYHSYSEVFLYSQFDAIVDFVGLGLAVFVFFAALRILKLSKLALMSVRIISAVGISYNVLAVVKDVTKIVYNIQAMQWRSYMLAGGIATCLLSIGFWCFVLYFFNRSVIRQQFEQA